MCHFQRQLNYGQRSIAIAIAIAFEYTEMSSWKPMRERYLTIWLIHCVKCDNRMACILH